MSLLAFSAFWGTSEAVAQSKAYVPRDLSEMIATDINDASKDFCIRHSIHNQYFLGVGEDKVYSRRSPQTAERFRLLRGSKEKHYKIWSVSAQKYMTCDATDNAANCVNLSDEGSEWLIVKNNNKSTAERGQIDIIPVSASATYTDQAPALNVHGGFNGNNGVDNHLDLWNANDANSNWQICREVTEFYTITVEHIINDVKRTIIYKNVPKETQLISFVNPLPILGTSACNSSIIPTDLVTKDETLDCVYYGLDYNSAPFAISPEPKEGKFDLAASKWYKLEILRTPKKNSVYNPLTNTIANTTETSPISPNALFAFVGDVAKGYRIYNMGAGANKILWNATPQNDQVIPFTEVSAVTDLGSYDLQRNGEGFVFRKSESILGFINDVKSQLGYWTRPNAATDAGSTIRFVEATPEELAAAYTIGYNEAKAKADAFIAANKDHLNTTTYPTKESYDRVVNSLPAETPTEAAQLLAATEAIYKALSQVTIMFDGIFTLETTQSDQLRYMGVNAAGNAFTGSVNFDGANKLWSITAHEGGYAVKNISSGKYLSKPSQSTPVAMSDTPVALSFYKNDEGKVTFGGAGQYEKLHCDAPGNIVGWEISANASMWKLQPIEKISVTITDETQKFTTFSAPFATMIPAGVKAYKGTIRDQKVILKEINDIIPANTGVVIQSENAGTFNFLRSAANGTQITDNVLQPAIAVATKSNNAYTLQNVESRTGFYPYNADNFVGFTAYIVNAEEGVTYLPLTFTDPTGINVAQTGSAQQEIHDLQGRRVRKTQPGIYIVNGVKKVIR